MTQHPCKTCGRGCGRECQRAAKRQTAIEAGEIMPGEEISGAELQRCAHDAAARRAGATDPTVSMKLDRLLARNALTSLGKNHPANHSRASRRAAGIRGPLSPTHAELKKRAQDRTDDG